ncbi:hypothetical protein [Dyella sp.]|uniref:hypothetical protein n=1 Tax=Dyella sp. TaxID=1869338 RepID=UPI002B48D344|nr:hypothetical protein [Dyella sp.]HKT29439.1 hypothetical protein [Dyella sp.]
MSNYRQPGTPYTGSASPKTLTSERIAADIAAFNKAGGHIEVLGNTPFHHKPQEDKPSTSAKSAATGADSSSGKK